MTDDIRQAKAELLDAIAADATRMDATWPDPDTIDAKGYRVERSFAAYILAKYGDQT
jgi:hypothetical protein